MSSRHTYTITAALPYANGPLHIGHFAGAFLPADIYARHLRRQGHEVLFVSGSDEGGAPITLQAHRQGVTPQSLVDKYYKLNKQVLEDFGVSFDIFFRTSDRLHHGVSRAFFLKLHQKKRLKSLESEQYYDPELELFLADRYLKGGCPHCSFPEAYGDQCESCGSTLSPQELVAPKSVLTGAPLVKKPTTHWYLPLEEYAPFLKQWILKDHTDWKANVYGQCRSWLQAGLRARAITRDLDWGVKVPLPNSVGKVLYVWFEAPIGYISATQRWAYDNGMDWKKFWKKPKTRLVHFIGKDNIVFHCLIFPAMLKAHGGYIVPHKVVGNEFMNLEGQKISTSRGHAVWMHEFLQQYPGQQDVLRYVLCANMPETKDSDFTWDDFRMRNNSELVGVFGNFVHRTLVLTQKYFEGKVPPLQEDLPLEDRKVMAQATALFAQAESALDQCNFRQGLHAWMDVARLGNKLLADRAPWKLWSQDKAYVGSLLHLSLQLCGHLSDLCAPFMPTTAEKLRQLLGLSAEQKQRPAHFAYPLEGNQLPNPSMLFQKIER